MALKKQNIGDFRELNVYRKSLIFNKQMNSLIESLPAHEKNNLSDQLKRASTSVCANIAEGVGNYYYKKEFDRLNTAIGSLCECRAFLDIATMLDYLEREKYRELDGEAEEILRMLIGMAKRIEKLLEEDAS